MLVIVPVGSLVGRVPDKAKLDSILSCDDRAVTVTVLDSIGGSEENA